ncbi:MAG: hypothetical protein R6X34_07150 [Chloroflexota bacterium]
MNERQNLLHHIANWRQNHQAQPPQAAHWNRWLPAPGNILFTLLMIGLLIFTQRAWATPVQNINAPGPSAVNYQGNLTAPNGAPKNGSFDMSFAIYNAASGGTRVWGPENHNAVPVSNGIFNIGLGSKTSGGIPTTTWNGDRYLQITVGGETLTPRELIRSVPLAGMALKAESANSLPVQQVQNSQSGWTPLRNARSFITEFDSPIIISRRSLILLVYSGSINCTQGSQDCYLKFYRDNQLILDGPYANGSMTVDQPISAHVTEVVDPGTYTYRLYVDSTQSATKARVFGSTLSIIIIPIE